MRIPTSTIVMILVTAVPFGLAIRDSVRGHDAATDDPWEIKDEARAAEAAQMEAELAREQTTEAASARALAQARDRFLGARPGTTGIALSAFSEPSFEQLERDAHLSALEKRDGHHRTSELELDLDGCDDFAVAITAKWGASPTGVWIDRETNVRASFEPSTCRLRFANFVSPAAWVQAIPFAAIGHAATELGDTLALTDEDEAGFTWHDAGAGGADDTTFDAYVKAGKLVGVSAATSVDADTADAIKAELVKQFGPAKTDPSNGFFVWKGRLPLQLDLHDGHVMVQAGALP